MPEETKYGTYPFRGPAGMHTSGSQPCRTETRSRVSRQNLRGSESPFSLKRKQKAPSVSLTSGNTGKLADYVLLMQIPSFVYQREPHIRTCWLRSVSFSPVRDITTYSFLLT